MIENLKSLVEELYGKKRILNKPANYILDQDHHLYPENQSINFDWQFTAELMLLTKIRNHIKIHVSREEGTKAVIQKM